MPCASANDAFISAVAERVDGFLHHFAGLGNAQARCFRLSRERILRSACRCQPIPAGRCHCGGGGLDARGRGGSQAEARSSGRLDERQDAVTRVGADTKYAGSYRASRTE